MKKFIYIILLTLVPFTATAQNQTAEALKEICASAKASKIISCDFVQTKTSRMLTKPMTTTGHLCIKRDKITIQYKDKTKTIHNIFSTDMQNEKKFKTEAAGSAAEWTVRLQPKQKRLARMYSLITIHFNRKMAVVDRIELQEKSGSRTDIRLGNIQKK